MEVTNTLSARGFYLSRAILLHRQHSHTQGRERAFATVHSIVDGPSGRPEIQAGSMMSAASLEAALRSLNAEGSELEFIEPKLLAKNTTTMVWWCAPKTVRMWFKVTTEGDVLGTRSGNAVQPGLVFAVKGGQWYVWAVAGSERPGAETVLFQAPYMNVDSNGRICVGNAEIPTGHAVWVPEAWEKAFTGSAFTHPNVNARGRLVKWPGGVSALWLSLLTKQRKVFPKRALVPLRLTVGSLIKSLANGGFQAIP